MRFLTLPTSAAWLFWLLAVVWSLLQGVAGYQYGLYICNQGRSDATPLVRRIYGFHHAGLYFATSFAGFLAWHVLSLLSAGINYWPSLSAGAVAGLCAIAGFAVLGISGALARILYLGQKPL